MSPDASYLILPLLFTKQADTSSKVWQSCRAC